MFCFQCQETMKGTGCTLRGVCGKQSQTSKWMDLLLSVVRAVGIVAHEMGKAGFTMEKETGEYVCDALFSTITNANFDDRSLQLRIERGIELRNQLMEQTRMSNVALPEWPELLWDGDKESYDSQGEQMGVLRNTDEDLRSLKELVMYGLKGMAAYYEHASRLGFSNPEVLSFMYHALSVISQPKAEKEALVALALKTGHYGAEAMALLDKANTSAYGKPSVSKVNIGVGHRPGILISGHDLHDLEDLLRQTEGLGIDIYTHGEMLPAHYYPRLRRYGHLVGNYGNAWWQQKEEFSRFNGPIIFTTNCIVPPLPGANYAGRVFTLNSTGYPGWKHIKTGADATRISPKSLTWPKPANHPRK